MTDGDDINAHTSVFETAPGPRNEADGFPLWMTTAENEGNTTLAQLLSHRAPVGDGIPDETLGDVLGFAPTHEDNLETLLSGTFLFTAESLAQFQHQGGGGVPLPENAVPMAPPDGGTSAAVQAPGATNKRPAQDPCSNPSKMAKLEVASRPVIITTNPGTPPPPAGTPPPQPNAQPTPPAGARNGDGGGEATSLEEQLALLQKKETVQQQELKLLRAALKHLYKKYQAMKTKYNEMKAVVRSHQAAQQQAAQQQAAQQQAAQQQAAQQQTSAAAYPTPFNQHTQPAMHGGMHGTSMAYQSPYSPVMGGAQIPPGFASGPNSGIPNPYAVQQGQPQQMVAASPGSFTGGGLQQQFHASLQQQQVAMYANMAMQQQQPGMVQPPVYANNNNGPTITFNGGTPNPVYQQQQQPR